MEYKSIDKLNITECCELLNLKREHLPDALKNIIEPSERDQMLIEQLQSLLNKDKSAFKACETIEQYEAYLSSWKDGLYHSHAHTRIAQLKAAADELAFYQENKDSISGCEAYLEKYPKGKYVNDVQSILDQKKKARKTCNIILLVLLLIAAGIFAYCNYVPVSYVNVDDNAELNNLGSEISLDISTDAISSMITITSSEDWIDCRVSDSGKTLKISADANPMEERTATITISAHSSFFGFKLSDKKQKTITITQLTGYASYLSVSNGDFYLTPNGGKSSVEINTDGIFSVSTAPASWVTTSINGNTLNLECDENPEFSRSSYLILKSGTKTLRLNITQTGKLATYLSVSTDNVSFSSSGGSRSITVSTDGEWQISAETDSWVQTDINGNTITISVDETDGDFKSDYFVIKSGNIEKRINISQEGSLATYLRLSKSSIEASASKKSYTVDVYTDGDYVTATTSANWIDVDVVGGDLEIEISKNNSSSSRNATITVKADKQSKQIRVSQKGKSSSSNRSGYYYCYNCQNLRYISIIVGYDYFGQRIWQTVKCPYCP